MLVKYFNNDGDVIHEQHIGIGVTNIGHIGDIIIIFSLGIFEIVNILLNYQEPVELKRKYIKIVVSQKG